jgi:alkyl sulfatase BDS1-like metallo-beta-lactamase superfamily hydrolase
MSQDVHWQVVRLAAQGLGNAEIAARVNRPQEVISEWRRRFYAQCLAGLDEQRPISPPRAA